MNSREKLLLVIVGVGLTLLAVWGAKGYCTRKTEQLASQRRYEQDRLEAARRTLAKAQAKEQEWRQLGKQTLSMDPMVAKGLFRTELVNLAADVGLPVPQSTEVMPGSMRPQGRSGVAILPYTVKTEGELPELVRLLFELYRQPYIVRCKSVRFEPVMNKPDSPNAQPTPTGRLKLTVYVETPILPPDRRVPKLETAQLESGKRALVSRPLLEIADAYVGAIKEDLFRPPAVQMASKDLERRPTTGPSKDGGEKGPVERPRKPADAELVLARVLSSPRIQQVVLEDHGNKNAPDKRVQVGDPLYLGKLIYVGRTGAVSQVEKDGTRLFHPVGVVLERGRPLSAAEHPAVFEAVAAMENRVVGVMPGTAGLSEPIAFGGPTRALAMAKPAGVAGSAPLSAPE